MTMMAAQSINKDIIFVRIFMLHMKINVVMMIILIIVSV